MLHTLEEILQAMLLIITISLLVCGVVGIIGFIWHH